MEPEEEPSPPFQIPKPTTVQLPEPKKINGAYYFRDTFKKSLLERYEEGSRTDLILECRGVEIKCHKMLIVLQSPFIKQCLAEMNPPGNRILLDNLTPHGIDVCIRFMYLGKLDVKKEEVVEVLRAIDYLQVDDFKEELCNRLDSFLKPKYLAMWRELSEHIDDPRIAIETKSYMCKWFDRFIRTKGFLDYDAVELGRFMMEMDEEAVNKDFMIEGLLRWMSNTTNNDPLEWLDNEQFQEMLECFMNKWMICFDETESRSARTYGMKDCVPGLSKHIALQKYVDCSISPMLIRFTDHRAYLKACRRVPRHLKLGPPVVTKHNSCTGYRVFRRQYLKMMGIEDRAKDIDVNRKFGANHLGQYIGRDQPLGMPPPKASYKIVEDFDPRDEPGRPEESVMEDKYDVFAGSRRFRQAIGAEVVKLIRYRSCSVRFLRGLLDPFCDRTLRQPIEQSPELMGELKELCKYAESRKKHHEDFMRKSDMRFAMINDKQRSDENGIVRVWFEGEELVDYLKLPHHYRNHYTPLCCAVPKGFLVTDGSSRKCCYFDAEHWCYRKMPDMLTNRLSYGLAYYKNRAWVIGGHTKNSNYDWINLSEYYDFVEKKWHNGPVSPVCNHNPGVAGLGDWIYVFAGDGKFTAINHKTLAWVSKPDAPERISDGALTTEGKKIYLVGHYCLYLFAYIPETEQWEELALMHYKHESAGLCWFNGRMFVSGGRKCRYTEEYDPEINEWMTTKLDIENYTDRLCILPLKVHHNNGCLPSEQLAPIYNY